MAAEKGQLRKGKPARVEEAGEKDSVWMTVRVERGRCAAGGSGVPAAEQLSGSGWTVLSLRIG